MFLPFDAHAILQIPLNRLTEKDRLIWTKGIKGNYSVKEAYAQYPKPSQLQIQHLQIKTEAENFSTREQKL